MANINYFIKNRSNILFRIFLSIICLYLIGTHTLSASSAYGSFSSLTTQLPQNSGFSLVKMDVVESAKNLELSPQKDRIVVKEPGLYFIIVSGQLGATQRGAKGYLDLWFEKNGKPVINSNIRQSIDATSLTTPITFQIMIDLAAGDTIATAFSASAASIGFLFFKPDTEPAVTSFYASIFKIDNL